MVTRRSSRYSLFLQLGYFITLHFTAPFVKWTLFAAYTHKFSSWILPEAWVHFRFIAHQNVWFFAGWCQHNLTFGHTGCCFGNSSRWEKGGRLFWLLDQIWSSTATSPYPGLEPGDDLCRALEAGHRLQTKNATRSFSTVSLSFIVFGSNKHLKCL